VRHLAPAVSIFGVRRTLGKPQWIGPPGPELQKSRTRVFAVAAVAQPDRFFADLAASGWNVAGAMAFRDHHWFTTGDVAKVDEAARAAGAGAIVTTDKDAVRLDGLALGLPLARVPLTVSFEPPEFSDWLLARIQQARTERCLRSEAGSL
jgi:tetraacyldisaccharide 4'-kinase